MLRLRDRLGRDHRGSARGRRPLMLAPALGDVTMVDDSGQAFGAFVPGSRCIREATGSGRLDGLTFAAKDLIDVVGTATGGGNPDWLASQAVAVTSAPVVAAALA